MFTYAQVVKRGILVPVPAPSLSPAPTPALALAPAPALALAPDPVQEEYDKELRNEQRYLEQRHFYRVQLPIKKEMLKNGEITKREFKVWVFENEPLPFY
jgi:hypothetical protein